MLRPEILILEIFGYEIIHGIYHLQVPAYLSRRLQRQCQRQ